jgi:D-3-phosphoglycerate dehydrogenase
MNKILITDLVHPILLDKLRALSFDVHYLPTITYNEFLAVVNNYYGVVINSKIKMNKQAIDKAKKLSFIARLGSGLDIIDLPYCKEKEIEVISSPGGNKNAVAEHAMGMLLCLSNNLLRADSEVRNLQWNREKNRGFELAGKTIGIIGFGNNGSAFARKWQGWDVKVLAYDKYKRNYAEDMPWVEEVDIDKLIEKSEIISLHIPLTEETNRIVDKSFLSRCQKDFILINTSRGKIINTQDLIEFLQSEHIKGACLDVFENEKPLQYNDNEKVMYDALFSMDQVVLSPHIAGWTKESLFNIASIIADKIKLYRA